MGAELLAHVDRLAEQRGEKRSEVVRRALEVGLAALEKGGDGKRSTQGDGLRGGRD